MNATPPPPAAPRASVPVLELQQAAVGTRLDPAAIKVAEVNWTVRSGEFWVVTGEQHSGKTDLLMLAAGLLRPAAGGCRLFGWDTRELDEDRLAERRRTGFVFEDGQLFPELTVLQNIALPLQYHLNLPAEEVVRRLEPLLDRMELSPLAGQRPSELSRNWRKRAGLARALAPETELLLLDNPLHGLGATHRQWWLRFLDRMMQERNLTVIVTTDDLRPWAGDDRRRFALLHGGKLFPAGGWNDLLNTHPRVVQALQTGAETETAETPN